MSCTNAADAAAGQIDHGEGVAQQPDEFTIDLEPETIRHIASYVLLKDCSYERLQTIDFGEHVSDNDLQQFCEAVEELREGGIAEDQLPDGMTVEDIDEFAEDQGVTDEQLKAFIELQTKIDDVMGPSQQAVEHTFLAEGGTRHKAIAGIVVVVVAAAVTYVKVY